MPKRISRGLAAALLLLSMAFVVQRAGAQERTVVRVVPAGGTYPLGSDIPVQLWVDDVEGLYGVGIKLAFDRSRLAVVEPQVVPDYDPLWPDMVVINKVDDSSGTIEYVAVQLSPRSPADGSGALFSFTFRTLSPGSAVTSLTTADLSDINGTRLECTTMGAGYWLGGTYRVFLPLIERSE